MNPLSMALVTGLMLRFGFTGRDEIDIAWRAIVKRLGAERAAQHVGKVVSDAVDALPQGAPADIIGTTTAGAIRALIEEWTTIVTVDDLAMEVEEETENPMLDFLVASWRARTSDMLNDENESAWWEVLVAVHGDAELAQSAVEAVMTGVLQSTVRVHAEDDKHAAQVGNEIVRLLLRLVDQANTTHGGDPS